MEDENVMKPLKERFSKHRIAMVKYCERKPRKTLFLKQALQLRKEAISQEPEKIQGTVYDENDKENKQN